MSRPCMHIGFEIKSVSAAGVFAGYASIFGVIDSQQDIVERGAFAEASAGNGAEVKLLWQHDPKQPIGILRALKEDALGLYVEAQLALDTRRGAEAFALLRSGALKGLSIGFSPRKSRISPATGIRHIQDVKLWEISLVTFPANAAAGVTVVKGAMLHGTGRHGMGRHGTARHGTGRHAAGRREENAAGRDGERLDGPQAVRLMDALAHAFKALR